MDSEWRYPPASLPREQKPKSLHMYICMYVSIFDMHLQANSGGQLHPHGTHREI